jgi:pimeloyl-ACP methyl ester carboxylesterase
MNLEQFESIRKTVETDAGELGYAELGEGTPAVFVHGLFVSSYVWRDVIEQLSDGRRCIAYDLPAHGLSQVRRDQDLSIPAQAEILEGFCQALGLEDIDLVANDTGGAFAQAFAVRRPDLLRSFTLTNCEADDVLPADDPVPQLAEQLAAKGELAPVFMQATDLEFARGELGIGNALEHPERITEDDLKGYFEPHASTEERAREVERFLAALDVKDLIALKPGLERLEVPTLIVWGTGDRFFPVRLAHWLKDTIPGAREVVEVEGGALFWPGERPDDLVAPLRRHWAAARAEAQTATVD